MVDTFSFDIRSSNSFFKSSEPETPPSGTVNISKMSNEKIRISKYVRNRSPEKVYFKNLDRFNQKNKIEQEMATIKLNLAIREGM